MITGKGWHGLWCLVHQDAAPAVHGVPGAAASSGTGGEGREQREHWQPGGHYGTQRAIWGLGKGSLVLLNPPTVPTSVQLKAGEGLVSLVIWVRVEVALIFLARVSDGGTTFLLDLAKKLVSYRCSFGFLSCLPLQMSIPFFFSFLLPYISLLLEILIAIQAPAFQVSIMQIHFSL